ncbi:FAD-dependent oxidoreductase [Chryseolinea lacunae]|uniref:FAD-dependent oxidoreductase n=1 Tax=Chryseolinea lacunae TaxID=2801331 RepID=A0ABS1L230_9BACT|nr:FAD-dependent oxidoreductase [Chryseolinea lacunae]MBL0745773.1 FAD-dependent oxidoreductase [Chryseolinea lacunae]
MKRRQFISHAGSTTLLLLAGNIGSFAGKKTTLKGEFVFLEAEQFADLGGWDLDQQSMDQTGSPYLLAHGLGVPVQDATTRVQLPSPGKYRVWVRTRDWVAPWNAPGAPGKFQVLINGNALPETFGTKGAEWHWHDGGIADLPRHSTIALHDLTGFEGRCEAILLCKDIDFEPTNDVNALTRFRRKLLGLPDKPQEGGNFDLAVIGGGYAGVCAALSAARNGLKVALIQDRPVLGGNSSSEVRVWPEGRTNFEPFPHIGDIAQEISPDLSQLVYGTRNARQGASYDDQRKLRVVQNEPRIKVMLEERAISVERDGEQITGIVIQNIRTARQQHIKATYFADCTGDAIVGYLAGAEHEISASGIMGMSNLWNVMDAANDQEVLKCECKDKAALAISCEIGKTEQPFPRCPWAIDLSDKPFPGRKNYKGQWGSDDPLGNLGGWFWESGFDKNPITDVEKIRDLNFRAMYGAWDALKNVDGLYPNHRLNWCAFIAGKRESRRLMGDVVLTAEDFRTKKAYPDAAFPCTWHIDLHTPHEEFDGELQGQEFISRATTGGDFDYGGLYWAPYRVLYSRNISNLFMAGRDISVSHDGLGAVRVMRTCGMMGEVVGKAAALCVRHKTTPRKVYESHLTELQSLLKEPGSKRI